MKSYNLDNIRLLLVEDSPHWRRIIRNMLSSLGVGELMIADDGKTALEILATQSVDLIICDWEMPEMDGLELVRRIRDEEESPNPFVPIIMLTAYTERHRVEEARDTGVTEVLTKPTSVKMLYERIAYMIENPREFIRTKQYFGPERRRKVDAHVGRALRRDEDQKRIAKAQAQHAAEPAADGALPEGSSVASDSSGETPEEDAAEPSPSEPGS